MNDRPEFDTPLDQRLNDVIGAYLEADDAGWAPNRQHLLARYPDLAEELEVFFAAQAQVEALAYPVPTSARRRADSTRDRSGSDAPTRAMTEDSGTGRAVSVGDYETLKVIKEGGMGVVFKAWQKGAERWVALKKIKAGRLASRAEVRRFRDEAEAAANLDHPHIVPIYEVGESDGQPFFSMKFFEHGSLQQHLPRFQKDHRAAARLLATVARAIHYAHQRGILHRDLKPANILLDAQEQPHVADFGLAKRLRPVGVVLDAGTGDRMDAAPSTPQERAMQGTVSTPLFDAVVDGELEEVSYVAPEQASDTHARKPGVKTQRGTVSDDAFSRSQTGEGAFVGTPGYIAPENAEVDKDSPSTAADVYSLGAILFKLLTGETLFQARTLRDTIRQIRECPPPRPRSLNPGVDVRLEAICLKCLEKDPRNRYASAEALAEDLDRWLRGDPPLAWPLPWRLRAWHVVRRHLLVGATAVLLGFAAATAFFVFYYFDPDRAPRTLEEEAKTRPVTLIGLTGPPKWSRWSEGSGMVDVSADPTKPFTIATFVHGRLELLRRPPGPHYRFSAEVRHEDSFQAGVAGIYFAHVERDTDEGKYRAWCEVDFADVGARAALNAGPDPKNKYSDVMLTLQRYAVASGYTTHDTEVRDLFLSASARSRLPDWRRIAVEVRHGNVNVFWEGAALPEHLTAAQLTAYGKKTVIRDQVAIPAFDVSLDGALGLYVLSSRASFRNVVIETLP